MLVYLIAEVILILYLLVPQTQANLITNGSFESPALPYKSMAVFPSIPGWTTTFGFSVEIQNNYGYGLPYDGNQFLELDGYVSSNIVQDVPTESGKYYYFSFAYSGRSGPTGENEIDVYWNGQLLTQLRTIDVTWELKNYTVMATNNVTRLEFRDVGESTEFGGYLDAVQLTLVPEPATLGLLGLGVMMARKRIY